MTTWDKALAETASAPTLGEVSAPVREALLAWLRHDGASDYERDRMHYGADLSPSKCERSIWYSLHDAPRDASRLGDELRFKGGRLFEEAVVSAFRHAGLEVRTQVLVRPLRPSAWCWSPGRADLVVVPWKKLYEIKAPRSDFFARAKGDPKKLVRESYRWQLSAYFHELKRRNVVDTASFLFLDREGSNEPVEVPLEGELLIPENAIVAEETRKASLLTAKEPPERVKGSVEVEVLKGRGKAPERTTRATARRHWSCSYCPYSTTCAPGPEESPVELTPELKAAAVAEAEKRWAAGEKRVVLTWNDLGGFNLAAQPQPETVQIEATVDDQATGGW